MERRQITIAKGDGIGPEIMDATLSILKAADAPIDYEEIEIGEKVYKSGVLSGIAPESWDKLRKNKVFLKAPITTPQGGGYKSLNVTVRKSLGLFANVRPCVTYPPFVKTNHDDMDVVIVRENEEDLYAGIEHQQTPEVVQTLKLVSRPGCEKIVRYAFEYAKAYGRKKVTCMTKDNIMKHTDGLFHDVFREVSKEYPDIEADHWIIDIGAAVVANRPETLDVVVTLNLYGDIISDIAAEISGSVGLGGSANIGKEIAMFEAIHGSAPDIAGKNMANPSGLLNAACMMLVHLGMPKYAEKVHNAWLCTIEQGYHTGDIYREDLSKEKVGTKEFAEKVIENLGNTPERLPKTEYGETGEIKIETKIPSPGNKELQGVDVFIDWNENDRDPDIIGERLAAMSDSPLKLKMITNRGVKVYPGGMPETFCTDHWRCRFIAREEGAKLSNDDVVKLLNNCTAAGFDFIKTEHLYTFDGVRSYSLGQGE